MSPELNQIPQNNDQARTGKNHDKSLKGRLKSAARKVVIGTPLAGLILSSDNVDNPIKPPSHIAEPTPVSAHLPDFLSFENIKVSPDKEGLPIEYILPDGKKVAFDKEEVKRIRDNAISSGEPEIIAIIPDDRDLEAGTIDLAESPHEPSPEHPKTSELPNDVLSEEELRKTGVKIIQADNTTLYIRKGAFEKNAPLADFNNNADRKMTIVLVNGPVVSPYVMRDPKYTEVRKFLPDDFREEKINEYEYKLDAIKALEEKLSLHRRRVKEEKISSSPVTSELDRTMFHILDIKAQIYNYERINDKALLDEIALKQSVATGSYYSMLDIYLDDSQFETKRDVFDTTIFIAVGKIEPKQNNVLYFTPDGKINSFISPVWPYADRSPQENQTHPNPRNYVKDSKNDPNNPDSYLYGGLSPGFSLQHELKHHLLIGRRFINKQPLDKSEYITDKKAMEGIEDAWKKWESSGFTDNSDFYFVLSLPEGGYILTEHKQPTANDTRKT